MPMPPPLIPPLAIPRRDALPPLGLKENPLRLEVALSLLPTAFLCFWPVQISSSSVRLVISGLASYLMSV